MLPPFVLAQEITLSGPLVATPPKKEDEKPEEITVRSKPPPRSASDWEVGQDTIESVPHETGADVLGTLPGVYVSNRGLLGQAPHLSVRGFEGTSGQDMEITVGSVPLDQVSNIRAPGYADMRLIMPEVIRDVRISHGPYDPAPGGLRGRGVGAHGPRARPAGLPRGGDARVLRHEARRPRVRARRRPDWRDSFAAFEAYCDRRTGHRPGRGPRLLRGPARLHEPRDSSGGGWSPWAPPASTIRASSRWPTWSAGPTRTPRRPRSAATSRRRRTSATSSSGRSAEAS